MDIRWNYQIVQNVQSSSIIELSLPYKVDECERNVNAGLPIYIFPT